MGECARGQRLTPKAKAVISKYAALEAGDLPLMYCIVRLILMADRMPREKLNGWLASPRLPLAFALSDKGESQMIVSKLSGIVRSLTLQPEQVTLTSGLLLIGIGAMLVSNRLALIAIWAQQNDLFLDLPFGGAVTPTFLVSILSGLLSFLSSCVLPLVPAYVGYLSGEAFGSGVITQQAI